MDVLKYLTNCKIFSTETQEENEEAWLRARTRGIGGSDVGPICGVSNYSCARQIYLKKTGQFEDAVKENKAGAERMKFGHLLEPIVADEFAKRANRKVVVSPATLSHKDYPWALANVDRIIVDNEGKPIGILECKTAGEYMKDDWIEGNLPLTYIYQLQWYLWVTGLQYGAFACLVGGNKFFYYEVYRNDDLLNAEIIPKTDAFWNYHVKELVMPELDGSMAATEMVNEQYRAAVKNSELVIPEDEYNELARTIVETKARIKELEKIVDEASNRIKDKLQEKEIGYTSGHIIKWSPRSQTRVDTDALKLSYPDVYEKCKKVISFRVLTIKGGI